MLNIEESKTPSILPDLFVFSFKAAQKINFAEKEKLTGLSQILPSLLTKWQKAGSSQVVHKFLIIKFKKQTNEKNLMCIYRKYGMNLFEATSAEKRRVFGMLRDINLNHIKKTGFWVISFLKKVPE